jgi:hypothetical protein
MSWNDVQALFSRISINKIEDDFRLMSRLATQEPQGFSLMKVTLDAPGINTFTVSQRGERMFDRSKNYEYSPCHMVLVKLNNGEDMNEGVTYIKGAKGIKTRDAHIEV